METKHITWDEAKSNSDKLEKAITEILASNTPKHIVDVLKAVERVDKSTRAIPNPNNSGQYCQLLLYPSKNWRTWSQTSMSISKYNLFR